MKSRAHQQRERHPWPGHLKNCCWYSKKTSLLRWIFKRLLIYPVCSLLLFDLFVAIRTEKSPWDAVKVGAVSFSFQIIFTNQRGLIRTMDHWIARIPLRLQPVEIATSTISQSNFGGLSAQVHLVYPSVWMSWEGCGFTKTTWFTWTWLSFKTYRLVCS